MKFFQKRSTAAAVMVLVIVAGGLIGQAKKPADPDGAATAIVGTALGIKPVLHVDDEGHLVNMGKARGRQASLSALVDRMQETAVDPQHQVVFLSHGDCAEDARTVEKLVKQRLGVKKVVTSYVGPVIGAHSGPGTVALFFLGTHR